MEFLRFCEFWIHPYIKYISLTQTNKNIPDSGSYEKEIMYKKE